MFHCIGCGSKIPWDGKGVFSYTCACGGRCFSSEGLHRVALPTGLLLNIGRGRPLPHLDDIVGISDYSSPEKEALIAALRCEGFVWMEQCEQCRADGTLERRRKRQEYQRAMEQTLARARLGELTHEEAIDELIRLYKAG